MPNVENKSERNNHKKNKKKTPRNKEFARITYVFIALFLCMMVYISYYQIVKSSDIINSPYNPRQDIMAEHVIRGNILDCNGNILAQTLNDEEGSEYRYYPYGDLFAHAVGYDVLGKAGMELAQNFNLLTSNAFFGEKLKNEFQDEKNMGDTIHATLDVNLQEVAYDAIGNYNGAAIVMEPDTGKILAMVSKSSFDPNVIAENWENLKEDENSRLLNRVSQGKIVPGSVFKIVTALEYMRENPDYESFSYNCPGYIEKDGIRINCYNSTVHGEQNLAQAFANSCNGAFVEMGLQLDNNRLKTTAEELMFNQRLPGEITSVEPSFTLTFESTLSDIMMTAMGQGETLTNPYHMALITSAVANGGTVMTPYIVDSISNYTNDEVKKYKPKSYGKVMSISEANQLSLYMQAVVQTGTGQVLNGQSYSVAGKTGTAEYSSDKNQSHSWFTGFANVDNPDIVVSVVIEQSNGNVKAINVAKQIMDAYYN